MSHSQQWALPQCERLNGTDSQIVMKESIIFLCIHLQCCCCLNLKKIYNLLECLNQIKILHINVAFGWCSVQSSKKAEETWEWSQNRDGRLKLGLWGHISTKGGNEEQQEPDGVRPEVNRRSGKEWTTEGGCLLRFNGVGGLIASFGTGE